MSDYTIEQGLGVRERMNLLAAANAPGTVRVLDLLNIAAGARCVDVGCGGGHVTMELARRVGPTGSVVGIDLDAELIEVARAEAAAQGLHNASFVVGAAQSLTETGLDLAFSRFLLMHVRDPENVLRLMHDAVRPGGVVLVEDCNFDGCFAYPSCPAYDSWVTWYRETVGQNGGDAELGLRLPAMLRAVGLTNIDVRVAQPAALDGPNKQLQQMSMVKMRSAMLAAGVATPADYDATHAELQAFTDDPTTFVSGPRVIQAWGRRA